MKKLGLATALLLAMTGAQAYQFEVQGQSEYIDASDANDKEFTGGLQGTFYFKDVDSSKLLSILGNFQFTPLGDGIRRVYDNFS